MTGLIIAMAALAVVVAIALARPLMRRDATPAVRAEYDLTVFRDQLKEIERDAAEGLLDGEAAEAARIEVQRRMLAADEELQQSADAPVQPRRANKAMAAAVAIGVPLAAAAMYVVLGSPEQPDQPFASRDIPAERGARHTASREASGGTTMPDDIQAMVGRLAEKLLNDPDDIDGWLLLGRSYVAMDRFDDAMNAYGRARKLAEGRSDVEIAYAEALILTNEMKVIEDAAAIFRAVREKEPFEPKSRYYLGLKKAQAGEIAGALQDWADLVAISEAEAPWVPVVRQQIARAAEELNIDPKTLTMSEEARNLLATQPPVLRPTTPIMPDEPAAAATAEQPPAAAPGPTREQMEAAQDMTAEDRSQMIRGMVERLADRLKDNPDDLAGWRRLERAYRVLGDTAKADEAAAAIKRLSQ
jgi:cytochrome c-type biogenesis protein CcmH